VQICENIVIPNLRLRDEDEECFEFNYVEYIRRDTEGSDSDTRRRAACELVKSLTEKFPNEVSRRLSSLPAVLSPGFQSLRLYVLIAPLLFRCGIRYRSPTCSPVTSTRC
jgi:hypothetical protein